MRFLSSMEYKIMALLQNKTRPTTKKKGTNRLL